MEILLEINKKLVKSIIRKLKRRYPPDDIIPHKDGKIILINVNPLTSFELAQKMYDLYQINGIKSVKPIPKETEKPTRQNWAAGSHSNNIFLIHGRDESNLRKFEKLLKDEWHFNPIVLKDKPAGGMKSIMEKLEKYGTDVGYAIVLFTTDDVGKLTKCNTKPKARARQNVIFECGLFMGWLRRDRMLGLFKGTSYSKLDWPTDIVGIEVITYERLDDKTRDKIKLELIEAGYNKNRFSPKNTSSSPFI